MKRAGGQVTPPERDPAWEPTYEAFLDQGRWLLADQQRRREGFRTSAATILGFDGLALTLLVGMHPRGHLALILSAVGAAAMAVSAFLAVLTLLPNNTTSTGVEDTLKAWVMVRHGERDYSPAQHFAEMLLTTPEARAGDPDEGDNGDKQALRSHVTGASEAGNRLAASAWALLSGVCALMIVVVIQVVQSWK